jgi:hypothetical protein
VLHESRFSRYEAFGHSIIRSKSGSIGLSQFSRLHRILLPQRQTENSEQALSVSVFEVGCASGGRNRQSIESDTIRARSETTSGADWYRGRAADCLALTEHAPTDLVKGMLADMAARWLRLAELVHRWEAATAEGAAWPSLTAVTQETRARTVSRPDRTGSAS